MEIKTCYRIKQKNNLLVKCLYIIYIYLGATALTYFLMIIKMNIHNV